MPARRVSPTAPQWLCFIILAVIVCRPLPSLAQATGVYRELFTGFNRANNPLWQLTNDTRFLNNTPTSTTIFASFSTGQNIAEDYGQRVRGFVTAPTTGNYTFWIASDEFTLLFLSTNQNPANKRLIAFCDPRSQPGNYTTHAVQTLQQRAQG